MESVFWMLFFKTAVRSHWARLRDRSANRRTSSFNIYQEEIVSVPRLFTFPILAIPLLLCASAVADERDTDTPYRAEYTSSHFRLHTDLPPRKARRLLRRLEGTLDTASAYWGRSPRGSIVCYVAQDAAKWPAQSLPHPLAKVIIQEIGGATYVSKNQAHQKIQRQATIFASAQPGVAEHESMHAYCYQTFGATGPTWYKEGMAELACYAFAPEVQCSAAQIEYLQTQRPPHLEALFAHVFANGKLSQPVFDALSQTRATRSQMTGTPAEHSAPGSETWTDAQRQAIQTARQRYYWTWAFCHLLYHHPRYHARFRSLGRSFVRQEDADFEEIFADEKKRISFEFTFFLKRIESGYRVDLSAWPWPDEGFTFADHGDGSATVEASLIAARGFQATNLNAAQGRRYDYTACGFWSTRSGGNAVDADGDSQGRGRLVGVLMKDYRLSEEFDLGVRGEFTAPVDGQRFLRCRDNWGQLGDNRGGMNVRITRRLPLAR